MRFIFKFFGIILILSLLRVQLLSAVTFTPEEVEHLEVQEVLKQQQVKKRTSKTPIATMAPIKKRAPQEQQDLVNYAWQISKNLDFILVVERESGFRRDAIGDGGTSFGLCQRHVPGQRNRWERSDDPAIKDGFSMLDKCRWSYQIKEKSPGGVGSWLHAYPVRHTVLDRFEVR